MMMRRFALFFVLGSGASWGSAILPSAFGPGKVVEGFESLTAGTNLVYWSFLGAGQGWLVPGTQVIFTFASGVTLTSPIPNPNVLIGDVLVGDWARGNALWTLGAKGSETAADVPGGTGYFGLNSDAGNPVSAEFTFPVDVRRVGAWVNADDTQGNTVTLRAYNAAGVLLETTTVGGVATNQWRNNFIGLEEAQGIRRVVFSGQDHVIDNLTFEPVAEPASVLLIGTGLLLLSVGLKNRRSSESTRKA